jgi:hypothetical protein
VIFNEFLALDENEQFETLWASGVYLSERSSEIQTFVLFQLDEFYIELIYDKKKKKIINLICFQSNNEALNSYLETIKIPAF